ncbi:hypothetical protein [Azospirillum largimobile]
MRRVPACAEGAAVTPAGMSPGGVPVRAAVGIRRGPWFKPKTIKEAERSARLYPY